MPISLDSDLLERYSRSMKNKKKYRVSFWLDGKQFSEQTMDGPRAAVEAGARLERYYAFPGTRISVSTTGERAEHRIERVS